MIVPVQVSAFSLSGGDRKPLEHGRGKGRGGCYQFITHKVP